jgi:hypothetical protein
MKAEATMKTMDERRRAQAVAEVVRQLGHGDAAARAILERLWDAAFEEGRLAALEEFQDRFCVCMK